MPRPFYTIPLNYPWLKVEFTLQYIYCINTFHQAYNTYTASTHSINLTIHILYQHIPSALQYIYCINTFHKDYNTYTASTHSISLTIHILHQHIPSVLQYICCINTFHQTYKTYRRCPDGTLLTQKLKLFRRGKKLFRSLIYE